MNDSFIGPPAWGGFEESGGSFFSGSNITSIVGSVSSLIGSIWGNNNTQNQPNYVPIYMPQNSSSGIPSNVMTIGIVAILGLVIFKMFK